MSEHHLEEPYNIDQIFEAGKWMLKSIDTGIPLQQSTGADNKKIVSMSGLPAPSATNNHTGFVRKEDLENAVNTVVTNIMNKLETLILTSFIASKNNMQTGLCCFCDKAGHTMTRDCCAIFEQYLHQGRVH